MKTIDILLTADTALNRHQGTNQSSFQHGRRHRWGRCQHHRQQLGLTVTSCSGYHHLHRFRPSLMQVFCVVNVFFVLVPIPVGSLPLLPTPSVDMVDGVMVVVAADRNVQPMTTVAEKLHNPNSVLSTRSYSALSKTTLAWDQAVSAWLLRDGQRSSAMMMLPMMENPTHITMTATSPISSSSSLILSSLSAMSSNQLKSSMRQDKVERVLDANSVQLQKAGIVKLAGVRMPSPTRTTNFEFPPCFSYQPSYKLRQLLPKGIIIRYAVEGDDSSASKTTVPSAVLIREDNHLNVNQELVRTGFAKVITGKKKYAGNSDSSLISDSQASDPVAVLDYQLLSQLEQQAKAQGLGIFQRCEISTVGEYSVISTASKTDENTLSMSSSALITNEPATPSRQVPGSGWSTAPFIAEFETLERSMETVWGDDGGRQQLRTTTGDDKPGQGRQVAQPQNPGDTKSCADFNTYEDALDWYERYQPYYGDVAKLDRDGDGVPCPGLPHTSDRNKYRMKVPSLRKGDGVGDNESKSSGPPTR